MRLHSASPGLVENFDARDGGAVEKGVTLVRDRDAMPACIHNRKKEREREIRLDFLFHTLEGKRRERLTILLLSDLCDHAVEVRVAL